MDVSSFESGFSTRMQTIVKNKSTTLVRAKGRSSAVMLIDIELHLSCRGLKFLAGLGFAI
jgi:hypothetical protein